MVDGALGAVLGALLVGSLLVFIGYLRARAARKEADRAVEQAENEALSARVETMKMGDEQLADEFSKSLTDFDRGWLNAEDRDDE